MRKSITIASLVLGSALLYSGCSNSADSSGGAPSGGSTGTDSLKGSVYAAEIDSATVKVYDVCDLTSALASVDTDKAGSFDLKIDFDPKKAYKIVASGGSYISEATLTSKEGGEFSTIVNGDFDLSNIIISPLTTFSVSRLEGVVSNLCSDLSTEEIKKAGDFIATTYGLGKAEDILSKKPIFTKTSDVNASKYAFALGVLEELAKYLEAAPKDLYRSLADDIFDGKFDGKKESGEIILDGTRKLPATAGVPDTIAAAVKYLESNESILAREKIDTSFAKDELFSAFTGSLSESNASSTSFGLDITNSGAITSVSSAGKQLLFVAARSNGIISMDITNPEGDLTINPMTTLNSELRDANISLSDIGGVIAVPGSTRAVVYSYYSKKVVLVDLDGDGSIINSADINISGTQSFSGGSAFISSGLPDIARNGIWLATTDGYQLLDLTTLTITKKIPLANGQIIAENIGGSTKMGLLFSPNYGTGSNGGLQIVDLKREEAYSMVDANYSDTIGQLPGMRSADGGSVDSLYGVGIITPEDQSQIAFVNLNDYRTRYAFNDGNLSDATDNNFSYKDINTSFTYLDLAPSIYLQISGVYTDSESHLALFMAGYSSDIAVGRLQDPSDVNWTGMTQWKYARSQYSYSRDPHAGAVIKSLSTGKVYGYLLDNSQNILQVDLEKFLDANTTDGHYINEDLTDTNVTRKILY